MRATKHSPVRHKCVTWYENGEARETYHLGGGGRVTILEELEKRTFQAMRVSHTQHHGDRRILEDGR